MNYKRNGITLFLVGLLVVNTNCQTPKKSTNFKSIKTDLDFSGRRVEEVNDPRYVSWPIEDGQQAEKKFGDVNVKFSGNINSGWYKVGVQAPHYARLVSDGLVSDGPLEMTVSGLEAGTHSLLTFHNTFDNPEAKSFAPVNIYINEEKVKTVRPSNRTDAIINSSMAYLQFEVENGNPVNIRFEADSEANAGNEIIVLNGFELDGQNMMNQARTPQPGNADEHVTVDDKLVLQWESPEGIENHKLYFGKDKDAVLNATKDSNLFKGDMTDNKYEVSDLYSMDTYYWRVDEVDGDGEITQGEVWSFKPAQLAFPGAQGYGRFAIGGRGGKVVEVTNLKDEGPGSLRYAVEDVKGPRTIVFNVSGNIELKSRLVVSDPYVTIAGQTAPGKGITLSRAPIGLTGDDGIIRFLRVRIGAGRTYDGMGLTGANHSIIDHSSISWTIDESFSSRGGHNITLQRTLISEALNVADHGKYEKGKMHGYAATIGGDIGSFHHNLLAHNYGRNWSMGGGLNGDGYYIGRLDIRNNVVYNWGHRTTDGGAHEVNFVNNFYKPGPSTSLFFALTMQHEGVGLGSQRAYFDGNIMPGTFGLENQEEGRRSVITNNEKVDYETFSDEPFFPSYVDTQPAELAYKSVLSDVGSNLPLDNHDKRIIQETIDSTFKYKGSKSKLAGMIDTEEDAGGWENYPEEHRSSDWDSDHDGLPNWWENVKGLNVNSKEDDFSEANLDKDSDGFTELEEYLDWMAQPHYFLKSGEELNIPVEELFLGFTNKPKYSVSGGEATLRNGDFYYTGSTNGLHAFSIEVEDADGDSMQRTVHVFVE
ncbi:pectate lyase family protein [Autumnicola musiva]|uniref:T9SS C-terminal target domain-containing protein n=1 Tax=Autumnicola musiva TaxID=3075589 RepID=A0ABU3D7S5_9FLAO|nr:T9SS C-terminal target domain-containing protein [Zunongwangia sp. F117]MDT0677592.1 T9SS C-terminal target domain-containing protein [Zunongwangia sp. F117]